MVEVELNKIMISETNDLQVIVLREKGGNRVLPIWIGIHEALAINRAIRGEEPPRPMTHDLLTSVIRSLGSELKQVQVHKFVATSTGGTFYARLVIQQNGKNIEVDARPSDAVAIAVRLNTPMYIDPQILEEEGQALGEGEEPEQPPLPPAEEEWEQTEGEGNGESGRESEGEEEKED